MSRPLEMDAEDHKTYIQIMEEYEKHFEAKKAAEKKLGAVQKHLKSFIGYCTVKYMITDDEHLMPNEQNTKAGIVVLNHAENQAIVAKYVAPDLLGKLLDMI